METGSGPTEWVTSSKLTGIDFANFRYNPVLLFDLLTWAGASTCYVWDCQNAGRIIRAARSEAEEIDTQLRAAAAQKPSVAELHPAIYAKRQIHFAACGADEAVPRISGMPDDLFTACLTTPLRVALLFYNLETFPFTRSVASSHVQRKNEYMADLWKAMSQTLKDRLWSELRAILSTIAWQTIDGQDYQTLIGQSGEVVSNLATGFLLSQRILPAYRAHPESIPAMTISTSHALWKHWDLILDNFFEQLPEYTDEGTLDTNWETKLRLVSFMGDQLDSILSTDQSRLPSEARLPIICRGALTSEYRERGCVALDACLRDLDSAGLARAVQGGALEVAAQLLVMEDATISPRMISIWASLVRNNACVAALAIEGLYAERLTSVPAVKFFLEQIERNLSGPIGRSERVVIQSAAVLSTIAKFVAGRQAPRFVKRTLFSASLMLKSNEGLMQQWGALLVAEVKGSIVDGGGENEELIEILKHQLLGLIESSSVETRASAVYALGRWINASAVRDISSLTATLDLTDRLAKHASRDGSVVVRKEIARLFRRVLASGGIWTTFTFWVYLLQGATRVIPSEKQSCMRLMGEAARQISLQEEQQKRMVRLTVLIKVLHTLRRDPDRRVVKLVTDTVSFLVAGLRAYAVADDWEHIAKVAFSEASVETAWTPEVLAAVQVTGTRLLDDWHRRMASELSSEKYEPSHELFEKSKLSLQVYLGVSYWNHLLERELS